MKVHQKATAVNLAERRRALEEAELPAPVAESPLFGVAMLKIAMELKKPEAGPLDEILSGVLSKMRIPEPEFRAFLAQNGGLLRTIAQRKKY